MIFMTKKSHNYIISISEAFRTISVEFLLLLIPLIGFNKLNLSNTSIGFAVSLTSIGYLFFGQFAGVLVDKMSRKYLISTLLFFKSIMFVLFSIMLIFTFLNQITYFLIVFLIGLAIVIIETAFTAWIPDIYNLDELSKINGLIQISRSSAGLIGPALGGVCISLIGENYSLFLISILLLFGSLLILRIKNPNISHERKIVKKSESRKKLSIKTFKVIFNNNILRTIVFTTGTINFSMSIYTTLAVVFLIKDLQLSETLTGSFISLGGIGALIGSVLSPKLIKKFGVKKIMIYGPIIPSFGLLLVGLSQGKLGLYIYIIGIISCFASRSLGSVARITIQQILIPSYVRGEVSGTMIMLTWGMIPLGSLFGGILSDFIGIRATIIIAAVFLISSNFWMLNKKIRNLHTENLKNNDINSFS